MISFVVEGTPAPQGSKTRTRYGFREASKRVGPWRELVRAAAVRAGDEAFLLGPLSPPYTVEMWFFVQRPRTTRAKYPVAPTVGDVDKLARAVNDALTLAGVIVDDRFIVRLVVEKAWAVGERPGVVVRVREVTA